VPASFRKKVLLPLLGVLALTVFAIPASAGEEEELIELVEGTAVLLTQTDGNSGSGSGGNSKSTTSSTNIFSPAAHADYKRFGGEPHIAVDRYPFAPGTFDCPATATSPCPPKDLTYASAPQGVPSYSTFYKSDDLGQTFRVPLHIPSETRVLAGGDGGGDSHIAIGEVSHRVYFVDLSFLCITMNVSEDLGETWTGNDTACINPVDDRQWVEADETLPATAAQGGTIYISAINLANLVFPTLMAVRNQHGSTAVTNTPAIWAADSTCNAATFSVGAGGLVPGPDNVATPCPDPADPYLWVAGPVVADREGTATRAPTHHVYIPFIRRVSTAGLGEDTSNWQLYIAKSMDGGSTWTRHLVHSFGTPNVNPANIFPQLAIDRGGNLYYTWSQTQGPVDAGEQDVYYTFSTNGGMKWASPINLTPEKGATAIFPWMVAGDPGRVDITYYKSNNGVNSNVAPPDTVWNVFFGQSLKALNTGANFNSVQVSAQPNHLGDASTHGLGGEADRDLLDFLTIEKDSRGAALIAYSDDHVRRNTDTRDRVTRQLSGNSLFKDQNINLLNSWPIKDHAVTDRAGDVYSGFGIFKGACPGMDLLGLRAERNDDLITFTLTLDSVPTQAKAIACSDATATGGIWGAEFGAATSDSTTVDKFNQFYIAYRANAPADPVQVEAGTVDDLDLSIQTMEFHKRIDGFPITPGGTCFSATPPTPCTLVVSAKASALGIKPGDGLYSITGLANYFFGTEKKPPLLRVEGGFSEQGDATVAHHYTGSGTPAK
jgi:hypothetical protein